MKRYRLVEEVEVIAMGVYSNDTDYVIPAGTEICLEEVEENPAINYRFRAGVTCSVCDKNDCSCPERQFDGGWKKQEVKEEKE